jgi:hypothetical protein
MNTKKLGKGKVLFLLDKSELDKRLLETFYVVEANNNEQHLIWRDNQYKVKEYIHEKVDKNLIFNEYPSDHRYEQDYSGFLMQVGTFHGEPVCISISFCKLDNEIIMFYYATSNTVNHDIIEEWLKAHCNPQYQGRRSHTDANNFHQCSHAVRDMYKEKSKKIEKTEKRKGKIKKVLDSELSQEA